MCHWCEELEELTESVRRGQFFHQAAATRLVSLSERIRIQHTLDTLDRLLGKQIVYLPPTQSLPASQRRIYWPDF